MLNTHITSNEDANAHSGNFSHIFRPIYTLKQNYWLRTHLIFGPSVSQADRHYAKTRLNAHENWPFLNGDRGSRWSAKHVHTKKAHNRPLSRAHKNWPCFLDNREPRLAATNASLLRMCSCQNCTLFCNETPSIQTQFPT